MTQTLLGERVGVIKQAVSHWETGKNRVPIEKIMPIAIVLETSPEWLLFGDQEGKLSTVQVVGTVRRGGIVLQMEGIPEVVPAPPGSAPGLLQAYRIEASPLAKFNPGDIIYVAKDSPADSTSYLGRAAVVILEDGRTFLRYIQAGDTPETITLSADTAPEMRNVRVSSCLPILFAMFA